MFGGLYEYIFGCTHDYKIVFEVQCSPISKVPFERQPLEAFL